MIVGRRTVQRIVRICDTEGEMRVADLKAARRRLDQLMKYRNMTSWAG
jgi:hypothetical protein